MQITLREDIFMRRKVLTVAFMSLVLVLGIISSVFAGDAHIHNVDCVHDAVTERTIHLDENGMYLITRSPGPLVDFRDGDITTRLFSTSTYEATDAIVDNPLIRDGTLDHALRCGGAISIMSNDFHTFNTSTGICFQVTKVTTNTCVRCWASMTFNQTLGGCGRNHF